VSFTDSDRTRDQTLTPLVATLEAAVPLWIWELRNWRPEHRIARAKACGQAVTAHGDQILFRSKGRAPKWEKAHGKPGDAEYQPAMRVHDGSPGTAGAFNRLAEGIACAAYQPGGITVFGLHWCAGPDRGGCGRWSCDTWDRAPWL
jgi:hypothetical protein